jgi:hypothetical protein
MTRRVLLVAHTGRDDINQLTKRIAEPLSRVKRGADTLADPLARPRALTQFSQDGALLGVYGIWFDVGRGDHA